MMNLSILGKLWPVHMKETNSRYQNSKVKSKNLVVYCFFFVFICGLFKDVTISDCIPSDVRMVSANKVVVKLSSVHPVST